MGQTEQLKISLLPHRLGHPHPGMKSLSWLLLEKTITSHQSWNRFTSHWIFKWKQRLLKFSGLSLPSVRCINGYGTKRFFFKLFSFSQKVLSLQSFRDSILYAWCTDSPHMQLVFLYYSSRLQKPVRRKKEIGLKKYSQYNLFAYGKSHGSKQPSLS